MFLFFNVFGSTLRSSCKLLFHPNSFRNNFYFKNRLSCVNSICRFSTKDCFTMKLDTPEFKQILSDELKKLLSIFHKYNYEIRIAGGAVRDLLMGQTPNDVDFATNATPEEMKDMFNKEEIRMINAKGEKHGTITARINTENFEVTTLRIDVTTDGRHAEVEFTKDWKLDAHRRDFTINSMFLGPDGTLYDYCNGYNDLIAKKVNFVGDANQRIIEDYLRILRYFRFFGKIVENEFDHDPETLRVIADNIEGLSRISGERIWTELKKILLGNYSASLVATLISCGAAKHIGLPVKPDTKSMKVLIERIKGLTVSPVTIISSLFKNAEEFETFHVRCRLSNQEKHIGLFIIEHRESEEPLKNFQTLLLMPRLPPVTREQITELFKYRGDVAKLDAFEKWEAPKLPINGNDLLKCGVPPGKQLGNVMNQLKLHWISKDFLSTKEELLLLVPQVAEEKKIKLNVNKV